MREIYKVTVSIVAGEEPMETVEWYADRVPDEQALIEAASPHVIGNAAVQRLQLDDTPDGVAPLLGWRMSKQGQVIGAMPDAYDARLNELERGQRNIDRTLALILQQLTSPPRTAAEANERTAAANAAHEPPPNGGIVPPRRPSRIQPTEDMNPAQSPDDYRGGSMGVVGTNPTSQIFSPGFDREGKPTLVAQPPSLVGDSLRKPFGGR